VQQKNWPALNQMCESTCINLQLITKLIMKMQSAKSNLFSKYSKRNKNKMKFNLWLDTFRTKQW